jgi:hypothetical protein
MNPATLPLWLGGLLWLFASRSGRRHSAIGIIYVVTLAEFIILHGKSYYLAPAYPILFAAGGVAVERVFAVRLQLLKSLLLAAIIVSGALLASMVLPILSPEKLVAYMRAIHMEPPRTETSHTAALPQVFADQFGWEQMVGSVAHVYHHLKPEDQKRVAIFCQNYGEAGAIDFFGRKLGLPPAIPGIRIIFCGDRAIGTAKSFWCSTRTTTTSASNSGQSKTSAKSRAARGQCPLNGECTFFSVAI